MKPWAQAAGNGQYWAFEVEGYPSEPYTDAQIDTLAGWHNFLGTVDRLAETPGTAGVGTHYMGGTAWGGHSCPDPVAGAGPRSRQRAAIIARAIALRTQGVPDMDATQDARLTHVESMLSRLSFGLDHGGDTPFSQRGEVIDRIRTIDGHTIAQPPTVDAIAAAVVALLPASTNPTVTAEQIAKAVIESIRLRLVA